MKQKSSATGAQRREVLQGYIIASNCLVGVSKNEMKKWGVPPETFWGAGRSPAEMKK